ncbi:hypothetical protein ICN48_08085 [Polynucleobacter sp. JS-Safj-400b-B2]|uniref:hypothetical protein n=1 Tax=Polynucleobacter sp. JS-Safj-400b-B2 TaxID=2576921 RepID=UPI001C0AFA77|nr:hypothetical protein [Polynucleobacter sp. JS-Safj-400b-B2]MBU3626189.1 hypothetical protein [Polynucleobacter sp. JS-Safj-400b-B2]
MKNSPKTRFPLLEFGADFDHSGVSVAPDWRYDLICDYLKASPSYEFVYRKLQGQKSPYAQPKDLKVVEQVLKDFGAIYKMNEVTWWQQIGMQLYGIQAATAKVRLAGELNENSKSISINKSMYQSLVFEIPLSLTISEAVKQVKQLAKGYEFSTSIPKTLKPKYQLEKIKLRQKNLQQGLQALRMYKKKMQLWQIGNRLNLVPSQTFDEMLLETKMAYKYSANKEVMSIAASRLIKNAALVAENAARGRFPNNRPFKEAILTPYEREAGRPAGSSAPKRRKALD